MKTDPTPVLISGCLLGLNCNYKGQASSAWREGLDLIIADLVSQGVLFLPVCPEQLGGMTTPRIPSELQHSAEMVLAGSGRLVNREGFDVTAHFVKGAQETLKMVNLFSIRYAIFKSKSPSCSSKEVYDGNFTGNLIKGKGIAAQLLESSGIRIFDENDLLAAAAINHDWQSISAQLCTR